MDKKEQKKIQKYRKKEKKYKNKILEIEWNEHEK